MLTSSENSEKCHFIWAKGIKPGRNQFVSFFQDVDLVSPCSLVLQLFADTRYRLWVNERFVAYGPARFVTEFPEFDRYDLQPWLKTGANRVRVEVNYYGASSYQSMPDGLPGFWAAGGGDVCDFSTPGAWKAVTHAAWDSKAPLFSFAQNPCEILDSRILVEELADPRFLDVETLPPERCPWKTPIPRSVPYPDYHLVQPRRILVAAPARNQRRVLAISLHDANIQALRSKGIRPPATRMQLVSWLYSEIDQELSLESFWSETELNGQRLTLEHSPLGNHGVYRVCLKKGWNFYSSNAPQLGETWTHLLAWPQSAGISAHALPERSTVEPWAHSPPILSEAPLPSPSRPKDYTIPAGWTLDSGDPTRATPARIIAWDQPDLDSARVDLPYANLSEVASIHATTALWCFDFQDEFYGQPVLDVEAPAGTVLDVAYDDWKRADGCVNLYNSNPFSDTADRVILRGGRQSLDLVNPRGGIFLQLVLRSPDATTPVDLKVHSVRIRSRQILNVDPPEARIDSGDELLDWIWNISTHTLRASTDEGYADCPWRERGSYIGDSLVNLHLQRLISADLSIARRTFLVMGQGQHTEGPRTGQLASVTPAWHRHGHDDFTLIWILCLRDYWAYTGDKSLLEETWPRIQAIWDSPVWCENAKGLWDVTPGQTPFIDWGVDPVNRTGSSNLILNAFRLGALHATTEIAQVLGKSQDHLHYRTEAARVRSALETHLWIPSEGRFAAADSHQSPCIHGQVLAILFGAGDPELLLDTIEPELRANFTQGIEKGQNSGHLELYFHVYLLEALAKHQRHDLALDIIREHFVFLKTLGYPTLNECFCRAARGVGSCCHSWSGYAAVYLQRYLIGLRQKTPGNPDEWFLDPHFPDWPAASLILPHPRGSIRVSWERDNGAITPHISAPEGVTVTLKAMSDVGT